MSNDLINREALLEKLLMPEKGTMKFSADVLDAIMEAPAVDALPVRLGVWTRYTTTTYVRADKSESPVFAERKYYLHKDCGRKSAVKETWCPKCGALMYLEVPTE